MINRNNTKNVTFMLGLRYSLQIIYLNLLLAVNYVQTAEAAKQIMNCSHWYGKRGYISKDLNNLFHEIKGEKKL
jgi:hypothetical protein